MRFRIYHISQELARNFHIIRPKKLIVGMITISISSQVVRKVSQNYADFPNDVFYRAKLVLFCQVYEVKFVNKAHESYVCNDFDDCSLLPLA